MQCIWKQTRNERNQTKDLSPTQLKTAVLSQPTANLMMASQQQGLFVVCIRMQIGGIVGLAQGRPHYLHIS